MTTTVIEVDKAEVRFGDCPTSGPLDPDTLTDFSCQVTRAEISASGQTSTTAAPRPFCGAIADTVSTRPSSFTLNLDALQDWTDAAGLSAFLFKYDATKKCFAVYLAGAEHPSATGRVVVVAGAFGGIAETALTSSLTMQIDGYPDIKDADGNSIRPDATLDANNISAQMPFSSISFPDLGALQADPTYGDGVYAGVVFGAGQYIVLGDSSQAHYTANAWASGPMA